MNPFIFVGVVLLLCILLTALPNALKLPQGSSNSFLFIPFTFIYSLLDLLIPYGYLLHSKIHCFIFTFHFYCDSIFTKCQQ